MRSVLAAARVNYLIIKAASITALVVRGTGALHIGSPGARVNFAAT